MAQVTVTINGRNYVIACDEGQEAHLARLGRYLDKRAKQLTASVGQINESLLLVMVSLLVTDELSDAYGEIETLRTERGVPSGASKQQAEDYTAGRIDAVAQSIETLARSLERA